MEYSPAKPSHLVIFNPTLGIREEELTRQLIAYIQYDDKEEPTSESLQLRHIGLIQGLVQFTRGFSNGKTPHVIETKKKKIVVKELEPHFWIAVGFHLTRITDLEDNTSDYVNRDISNHDILAPQIIWAYRMYRLHRNTFNSRLFYRHTEKQAEEQAQEQGNQSVEIGDLLLKSKEARNNPELLTSRKLLCETAEKWWRQWFCNSFDFTYNGRGVLDLFYAYRKSSLRIEYDVQRDIEEFIRGDSQLDAGRITSQGNSESTSFGPGAYTSLSTDLIDIIIYNLGADSSGSATREKLKGVVYPGCGNLHLDSVVDISKWLEDLTASGDEVSFVASDGFTYRKSRSGTPEPSVTVFDPLSKTLEVITSVAQVMEYIPWWGRAETAGTHAKPGQIPESRRRYIIGYRGKDTQLWDTERNDTSNSSINQDSGLTNGSSADLAAAAHDESAVDGILTKTLCIQLTRVSGTDENTGKRGSAPGEFVKANIVLIQIDNFLLAFLYKHNFIDIHEKPFYERLMDQATEFVEHIRSSELANSFLSLSTVLSESTTATGAGSIAASRQSEYQDAIAGTTHAKHRDSFYFIVYDPKECTIQTSLPCIPDEGDADAVRGSTGSEAINPGTSNTSTRSLDKGSTTVNEDEGYTRSQLIHVHEQLSVLLSQTIPTLATMDHTDLPGGIDTAIEGHREIEERFDRTSKGWWIYFNRLDDGRLILVIRKWRSQRQRNRLTGMRSTFRRNSLSFDFDRGHASNGLHSSGDSANISGALGKDVKAWIDEFKLTGKV